MIAAKQMVLSIMIGLVAASFVLAPSATSISLQGLSSNNYVMEWNSLVSSTLKPAYATSPSCPSGTTFNSNTNQCESAPICPSNMTFNSSLLVCTADASPVCSIGTLNTNTNQCESEPNVCPTNFVLNNNDCVANNAATCPAGSQAITDDQSSLRGECVTCPSGSAFDTSSSNCETGNLQCPTNFVLNNNDCVANNAATCPAGSQAITDDQSSLRGECVTCPSGSAFDTSIDQCAIAPTNGQCPTGLTLNGSLCTAGGTRTDPTCTTGTNVSGTFDCHISATCPTGLTLNGSLCTAGGTRTLASCAIGTNVSESFDCHVFATCPSGSTQNGSVCDSPPSPTCSGSATYNSTDQLCEANYSCPTGTTFNSNTDLCVMRPITIDIKPGGFPNSINLKNDQTVTVAVLGSNNFDVKSIVIGPTSSAPTFGPNNKSPIHVAYSDVNKDGYLDLIVQYKVSTLGFTSSSTQGCIAGTLIGGTPISGCDSVRVVMS